MVLYRPSGSMKLVCNFLQTLFYRQSNSIVFEAFVGTNFSLR